MHSIKHDKLRYICCWVNTKNSYLLSMTFRKFCNIQIRFTMIKFRYLLWSLISLSHFYADKVLDSQNGVLHTSLARPCGWQRWCFYTFSVEINFENYTIIDRFRDKRLIWPSHSLQHWTKPLLAPNIIILSGTVRVPQPMEEDWKFLTLIF